MHTISYRDILDEEAKSLFNLPADQLPERWQRRVRCASDDEKEVSNPASAVNPALVLCRNGIVKLHPGETALNHHESTP